MPGGHDHRRAAEQAARLALAERINTVGALGLAAARRTTTTSEEPARAAARAEELLAAARTEGRKLREEARAKVAAADDDYAAVHAAALAAGWTPAELKAFGYPTPRRVRTVPAPATAGAGDTDQGAATAAPSDDPARASATDSVGEEHAGGGEAEERFGMGG